MPPSLLYISGRVVDRIFGPLVSRRYELEAHPFAGFVAPPAANPQLSMCMAESADLVWDLGTEWARGCSLLPAAASGRAVGYDVRGGQAPAWLDKIAGFRGFQVPRDVGTVNNLELWLPLCPQCPWGHRRRRCHLQEYFRGVLAASPWSLSGKGKRNSGNMVRRGDVSVTGSRG